MEDIENKIMKAVVIKINILKKDEKLSNERNELVPEIWKADLGIPNWNEMKINVTTKPAKAITGRIFLLLLNIKSKTTIATKVMAKDISGNIP